MKEVLIITDEKRSSINQCFALFDNLKEKKKIGFKHEIIKRKLIHELPNSLIYLYLIIKSFFNEKRSYNVDCIISCGRISAPYSLILKKMIKCKNIHILDPYFYRQSFDKIILPSHDVKKDTDLKNVIETIGTLVKKEKFLKSKIKELNKLNFAKKILTCFIGGDGKSSRFSESDIYDFIKRINNIKPDYAVVYCLSRRTSENIKNLISKNKRENHFLFDYKGINPYWYLINRSSLFIVTQDSVSMISDSISTGKPVYLLKVSHVKEKIKKFSDTLISKNIVRFFDGKIQFYKYKPLNESSRVSKIIKNLF